MKTLLLFLAFYSSVHLAYLGDLFSSSEDEKECVEILAKLKRAKGLNVENRPFIKLVDNLPNTQFKLAMASEDGVIYLEERTYALCKNKLGAIATDALAFIIAHELAHYTEKHVVRHRYTDKFKPLDQDSSFRSLVSTNLAEEQNALDSLMSLYQEIAIRHEIRNNEAEADLEAGFTAYLAGYQSREAGSAFLKLVYESFPDISRTGEKYVSLEERILISERAGLKLDTLISVFEAGNYLSLINEYDLALQCYQYVARSYQSKELLNNMGVLAIKKMMSESELNWLEVGYILPINIELNLVRHVSQGDVIPPIVGDLEFDSENFVNDRDYPPDEAWLALDTDSDGEINSVEIVNGTDPYNPCSFTEAPSKRDTVYATWSLLDCDQDGESNHTELKNGTNLLDPCSVTVQTIPPYASDRHIWGAQDCDGDGFSNETETMDGTDPFDPCSNTDPFIPPNHLKHWDIWGTADCDQDGESNQVETEQGTDPFEPCSFTRIPARSNKVYKTWSLIDCDGDGDPNGLELKNRTDIFDPCSTDNPVIPDDSGKYYHLWALRDCDEDGENNKFEAGAATDPFDPCSYTNIPAYSSGIFGQWQFLDCDKDGLDNGLEIFTSTFVLSELTREPIEYFEDAIRIDPDFEAAHLNKSIYYFLEDKVKQSKYESPVVYDEMFLALSSALKAKNLSNNASGLSKKIKAEIYLMLAIINHDLNQQGMIGRSQVERDYIYIAQTLDPDNDIIIRNTQYIADHNFEAIRTYYERESQEADEEILEEEIYHGSEQINFTGFVQNFDNQWDMVLQFSRKNLNAFYDQVTLFSSADLGTFEYNRLDLVKVNAGSIMTNEKAFLRYHFAKSKKNYTNPTIQQIKHGDSMKKLERKYEGQALRIQGHTNGFLYQYPNIIFNLEKDQSKYKVDHWIMFHKDKGMREAQ